MIQDTHKTFAPDDKNVIFENAIKCKVLLVPLLRMDGKAPTFTNWNTYKEFDEALMREWQKKYKHIAWGMPTHLFFAVDKDGQNWGKLKPEWLKGLPSQKTKNGEHWLAPQPENKLITKTKMDYSDFDIIGINSNGKNSQIRIYDATLFDQLLNCPPAPPELIQYLRDAKATNPNDKDYKKTRPKQDKFSQSDGKWQKGTRNRLLNENAFNSVTKGDPMGFAHSVYKAGESGYPWEQTRSTIQSILNNLPEDKQQKTNPSDITFENKEITEVPDCLIPGFIQNSFGVWAGMPGKGKSTTLHTALTLNALGKKLPGTNKKGNKKPFFYHSNEHNLGVLNKLITSLGGKPSEVFSYMQKKPLSPMAIARKYLMPSIIRASELGKFSAILIDRLYMLFTDQKRVDEEIETLLRVAEVNKIPILGVCSLKKMVKDQEVLHHIWGHSDIVNFARYVAYMREGKEKNERVIVKLKNSYGSEDDGFLTTKDGDLPIDFEQKYGDKYAILNEFGKPWGSYTDAPRNERGELIALIKARFTELGGDYKWLYDDFKIFLQSDTHKEWSKLSRNRLLKACGLVAKIPKNDTKYYLVERGKSHCTPHDT